MSRSTSAHPSSAVAPIALRALLLAGVAFSLSSSVARAQQNEQQLLPADTWPFLHFGWSLDVEGGTAVVGAFGGSNDFPGALYVYERVCDQWVEAQVLRPSDGRDTLATTVALSGDTFVAGSYAGTAYVFAKTAAGWEEQAILRVNGGLGANIVSLDGDTAVVSAPWDELAGRHSGSAHVFVRRNGLWSLQQRVIPRDSASDDFAGPSAVQGDTLLLATPGKDLGRGAVYVFQRFGSTWVQCQKLLASDGLPYEYFGSHVVLDGDTAAISTSRGLANDAVYVFRREGTRWKQEQKLLPDHNNLGVLFGESLAIAGDSLLVGSGEEFSGTAYSAGAAYLFQRRDDTWIRTRRLVASDASRSHYFGLGVALSDETILVGAPLHEGGGHEAGLAYAFERPHGPVRYENGRGINVNRLTTDVATLGGTWEATIDVVGPHRPGPAFLLISERQGPGRLLQHGTVESFLGGELRAVAGPVLHAGQGSQVRFTLPIPIAPELLGSSWCAQGIVRGGVVGWTNAASGVVQ